MVQHSVSIIICTCNRASVLKRCLDSISKAHFPPAHTYELIVVDNRSSDHTKAVCEAFHAASPIPCRYIYEERRGKSNALNRALASTRGDIIFLTDDDCVFREDLPDKLVAEFSADPGIDFLGGRVELFDPLDLPIAIRLIDRRTEFTSITQLFGLIPGCNMAFRRRVVDAVGGFDPRFGPGTPLIVEDADFIYRAFRAGFRLVYSPEVVIYHGHGRRDADAVHGTMRSYLLGRGAFYAKYILAFDRKVLRIAYWETVSLLKLALSEASRGKFNGDGCRYLGFLFRGASSFLLTRSVV